jgi:hypothetical protein
MSSTKNYVRDNCIVGYGFMFAGALVTIIISRDHSPVFFLVPFCLFLLSSFVLDANLVKVRRLSEDEFNYSY